MKTTIFLQSLVYSGHLPRRVNTIFNCMNGYLDYHSLLLRVNIQPFKKLLHLTMKAIIKFVIA